MPSPKKSEIWSVPADSAGERLDKWLAAEIQETSRTRVQQLIEQGKVNVNGEVVRGSYRVAAGDKVAVTGVLVPPPLKAIPEDIPLQVVFEDKSIAVIDKPAGMSVHAGAGHAAEDEDEPDPRTRGTLVNALLFRFRKLSAEGGDLRPGIVHRLDKDTSGLIIVAKSDVAHRALAEQFSSRRVHKRYIALVHGWPRTQSGDIHQPIGRDRRHRHRMAIDTREGREAHTHFKVLKQWNTAYGKFALLEVTISTGRTHQIRVHLSSIGLPIAGDTLYGAPHEIALLGSARPRAARADTKANRNREAMELARELTEAKTGETRSTVNKRKKVSATEGAGLPHAITLARQFLHAAGLEFTHPDNGRAVKLASELPADLARFQSQLERSTR